jgi:hypothetical protein
MFGAGQDYRRQASIMLQTFIHFDRPDPSADCYTIRTFFEESIQAVIRMTDSSQQKPFKKRMKSYS